MILRTNHRLRWPFAFPGLLAARSKGSSTTRLAPRARIGRIGGIGSLGGVGRFLR